MPSSSSSVSLSVTRQFILWGMSLLAGSTVLTHGFQLLGFSFQAYSWTLALLSGVLTAVVLSAQRWRRNFELERRDLWILSGLIVLCLVGGVIAVLSYRPDLDDYYYAPNAVYYLQHPDAAMGFGVHFINSKTHITSLSWGTSLPYEYARAAFAYLAGLDFLSVYYFVTAGIVGGSIPLSYFYLLGQFTNNNVKSLFSSFIAISILLLMGDTHRSPGNFAFVRAFQGKALLLSAGIPIIAGATIEFFRRRSIQSWLLLFATTTGLVATSASAAVILPALGSVVGLALLLQQESWREVLRYSLVYGLSYAYLFSYAACILMYSADNLGVNSPVNEGWPTSFWGHIDFFVNRNQPVTPLFITAGTGMAILNLGEEWRRIFWIWALVSILIYLNPIVADFHIKYITSPNIYWRMAYIYPVIVAVGAIGFWSYDWLRAFSQRMQAGILGIAMVAMVAAHIPWFSSSSLQSNMQWFPLKYPVHGDLGVAERVAEEAPAGGMLAPFSLSGPIVMVSSDHPQMRVRSDGVLLWLGKKQAERRIGASKYGEGSGGTLRDFQEVAEDRSVCSVVVADSVAERGEVRATLSSAGYKTGRRVSGYVVYMRHPTKYDACKTSPHGSIEQ